MLTPHILLTSIRKRLTASGEVHAGADRGATPELMREQEPYVAAVVASMDRYMGRYAAQVKLQGPKVAIVLVRPQGIL